MRRISPALWGVAAVALVLSVAGASLGAGGRAALRAGARPFEARRALQTVRFQVGLGPRRAGSPANRALGEWLRSRYPGGRFEDVPGGLRNVVYELPGSLPAVVVGAHYDTDDIPGFVGANDGGSGTATLLELLRDLRGARPGRGAPALRFVFFDGEEKPAADPDFLHGGLRGSRAYVRAHHDVGAMILLDFVGNRGLVLAREANSDPRLWADLRAAARRAGELPAFPARTSEGVLDDTTPFAQAGVPAIDLIDFAYPCYDRVCDTLDKISAASLAAAGRSVRELLVHGPLPAPVAGGR